MSGWDRKRVLQLLQFAQELWFLRKRTDLQLPKILEMFEATVSGQVASAWIEETKYGTFLLCWSSGRLALNNSPKGVAELAAALDLEVRPTRLLFLEGSR